MNGHAKMVPRHPELPEGSKDSEVTLLESDLSLSSCWSPQIKNEGTGPKSISAGGRRYIFDKDINAFFAALDGRSV